MVTRKQLRNCLNKCFCEVLELKVKHEVDLDNVCNDRLARHYTSRINELHDLLEDIGGIISYIDSKAK